MLQTLNDFENWKKMDAAEPFKPEGFKHIREGYSDPEGYFMGAFIFELTMKYRCNIDQLETNQGLSRSF